MKALIQVIFILAVFAVARTSAASNIKSYHGAICTSQYEYLDNTVFKYEIGIVNGDPDNVFVICPLIRDQQWSSSQVQNAYVETYNFWGGSTLSCWFVTQNEDSEGTLLDFDLITTDGGGFQQLGPFSVETSYGNEGSYSLYCELGSFDAIYHIWVTENE